jgi:ribulose-phosphate 3-epimerase
MAEIIPAIGETDFQEIRKKIDRVDGLTDWVQIDVADGLFASNFTWENWTDLNELGGRAKVEVHLMVEQPEHYVADWMKVADRVIIHPESTTKLPEIFVQFAHSAVKLGAALLLETPLETIYPVLDKLALVQLMGIRQIGQAGEPFASEVLEKVRALRAAHPEVKIGVDGGVNLENAPELLAAGADTLVVGSAIWDSANPAKTVAEFKKLTSYHL